MGREGPSKRHGCLRCEKRPRCRKLCARMLRMLPNPRNRPGVSMLRGLPTEEDELLGDTRRPSDYASYANQKLLELADSIREKFRASQWRAMNRIWGEGYRRSDAAEMEGVSPSAIRKRMLSAARILRRHFGQRA